MLLRLVLLCLCLAVSACAVGPDYQRPQTPTPDGWTEASARADAVRESPWWLDPNDAVLTALERKALSQNLDIALAVARVEEARAGQRGAVAELLPTGSVTLSPTRSQLNTKAKFKTDVINTTDLAFNPAWEIDVFGGIRRGIEAATADLAAAGAEHEAVEQLIAAEVGRAYASLRDAEMQYASTKANVASQLDTYKVVDSRFQAGLSSALAASQAKRAYESTMAQLPVFTAQRASAKHRLERLCGVQPGQLDDILTTTALVPTPPEDLWLTSPRSVLASRPDILAAERRLAAATARIGVAKSDFFPKISLTALLGAHSTHPETVMLASGGYWQYGASGLLAILDFPRIQANVKAADAKTKQALASYEQTVLTALSEVETTLSAYGQEMLRRDDLILAEATAKDAMALARERFIRGIANFLDVLDAERELTRIQTSLVQSRAAVFSRYVDVQSALGAKASLPQTPPEPATPAPLAETPAPMPTNSTPRQELAPVGAVEPALDPASAHQPQPKPVPAAQAAPTALEQPGHPAQPVQPAQPSQAATPSEGARQPPRQGQPQEPSKDKTPVSLDSILASEAQAKPRAKAQGVQPSSQAATETMQTTQVPQSEKSQPPHQPEQSGQ